SSFVLGCSWDNWLRNLSKRPRKVYGLFFDEKRNCLNSRVSFMTISRLLHNRRQSTNSITSFCSFRSLYISLACIYRFFFMYVLRVLFGNDILMISNRDSSTNETSPNRNSCTGVFCKSAEVVSRVI